MGPAGLPQPRMATLTTRCAARWSESGGPTPAGAAWAAAAASSLALRGAQPVPGGPLRAGPRAAAWAAARPRLPSGSTTPPPPRRCPPSSSRAPCTASRSWACRASRSRAAAACPPRHTLPGRWTQSRFCGSTTGCCRRGRWVKARNAKKGPSGVRCKGKGRARVRARATPLPHPRTLVCRAPPNRTQGPRTSLLTNQTHDPTSLCARCLP